MMCDVIRGREVRANTLGLSLCSILARSGEKKSALGHQRYTWILVTSCIFMWCIVMRYPLARHGQHKKHRVCNQDSHNGQRVRSGPHQSTHNQRFSGFILFSPNPPPPASGLLMQDRQLGKTSQTNYGNIRCGMNNFCKIWEDRVCC